MKNSFCKGWIKLKENISTISEPTGLIVEIANHSNEDWRSGITNQVCVSYHWLDEKWNIIVFEGCRTLLAAGVVAAGATITMSAEVQPPEKPGKYWLMFTLVREGMYWFDGAEEFNSTIVGLQVGKNGPEENSENAKSPPQAADAAVLAGKKLDREALIAQGGTHWVSLQPYEKERRFGFMHVPKTAGTSMRDLLRKAIQPKAETNAHDRSLYTGIPDFGAPLLPHSDCYLGHLALSTLLVDCAEGQYLTVFREASCRILSHWLYWASLPDEKIGPEDSWRDKFRKSLFETLSEPAIACQFDNVTLRMLVWPHPAVPDLGFIQKKDDQELLLLAFERLKKFSYLDVIENPRFKENLSDWFGTNVQVERINVTGAIANGTRINLRREFSSAALEALEARSRLDRVLWTTVAAARMPGTDLERLTRDTLMTNVARYGLVTSVSE
jgi:hypothetical protein